MPSHRANLTLGYNRVVYMQFERTIRLVVLAHPLFSELDADDVLAGRGCVGGDTLFRRNAEEVVTVGDLAVFHIQRVTAEARAIGKDDATRVFRHINLG